MSPAFQPPVLNDAQIDALLAQDAPHGDLTTHSLGIGGARGVITMAARGPMVLCAAEEAARMLERVGAVAELTAGSGATLTAGEVFLRAKGTAGALHRAWKVAQTLVEYASGISTRADAIVKAARAVKPDIAVACTRKNFPGTKDIGVKAVLAGGAAMHRLGLSETILVFPEHRAFLDGPLSEWMPRLKAHAPERKVVVETADADDALELARAGADVIQLEKLSPDAVRAVVEAMGRNGLSPVIAAAGGVDETNAAAYAVTGCHVLVTSAPYFSRPADVKVVLTRG